MWQLPLTASSAQQSLYILKALEQNREKMGNQMLRRRKERQPSHFVQPWVPQTLGHKSNSQITIGNRKHLQHKHLDRIMRHLLFRPFQSTFSGLLENSEEKLLKCSSRPGWDSAAGSCQGCSTQHRQITQRNGPKSEMALPPLSPSVPLASTQSPALAGC